MRFHILEDLEDELIIQREKYLTLVSSLSDIFEKEEFKKKEEVNGTSFSNKEGSITSSFYIDNSGNYVGYVTNNSDDSLNYSIKGKEINALKAAEDLIDMFNQELENEVLKDAED